MNNSQVNAKQLYDVTGEILNIMDELYLEIDELQQKNDNIMSVLAELKETDGKKVSVNGISNEDEISPQMGFKRCRVYGHIVLEEKVSIFQNELLGISDIMDFIYSKIKTSRGISEDIEKEVANVENVLNSGAEVMVFQDYMNQQNNDMFSKEQVMDAVQSNFEQNRVVTNQVNQEVYTRAYEKLQDMLSNSGGDRL